MTKIHEAFGVSQERSEELARMFTHVILRVGELADGLDDAEVQNELCCGMLRFCVSPEHTKEEAALLTYGFGRLVGELRRAEK